MAKGSKKARAAQAKISQLEVKKRNGILAAVGAIVGMAVVIALKLFFQYQMQLEWADTPFASMTLFVLAMIAAAVAGWGTRSWRKARDEIRMLEQKYKP